MVSFANFLEMNDKSELKIGLLLSDWSTGPKILQKSTLQMFTQSELILYLLDNELSGATNALDVS